MCSKNSSNILPVYFTGPEFVDALWLELTEEEKEARRWPVLLLKVSGRKLLWRLCTNLDVSARGIPGSACRLLERYFCYRVRTLTSMMQNNQQWETYRNVLVTQHHLVAAACIQLAAKMVDVTAPLTATLVRLALLKEGITCSKADIVRMEFHVYKTLGFRIPLWTTLDAAEFLAIRVGACSKPLMKAIGFINNLTEFHRNELELHMKNWTEQCNTPGSSSSSTNRRGVRSLHISAASVYAAVRFLRAPVDALIALAFLTRTTTSYINAIADVILNHIITG